MSRRLDHIVTQEEDGIRVDTVLRRAFGLSGTVIRRIKWLPDGILLDGQRVHTDHLTAPGQTLSVLLDDPIRRSGVIPNPGPLDIVYEDSDVIVLNKSAGVLVHPTVYEPLTTLGNYLLAHYDATGQPCDFHPIHRLDKGTSGLLAAAKHPHAQTVLKGQLHTGGFRRVYLAICEGVPQPPSGVIDAPLGPRPGSPIAQAVLPGGKPARTHYRVLEQRNGRALVSLELETGRTHQIRVHLAHLGHPLTGDFLYGVEEPELISRPALHSHKLTFRHPITKELLTFTQDLPSDMATLIAPHPFPF